MCCDEIKEKLEGADACFDKRNSTDIERGKKFTFQRPKGSKEVLCRIKVDGCLITSSGTAKCDFAFVRCEPKVIYFVELKGGDVVHAIEQIEGAFLYFRSRFGKNDMKEYLVEGRVVCSKFPKVTSTVNKLKEGLYKRHRIKVKVYSKPKAQENLP